MIKYATLKDETGDYGNYTDTYMWSYNRGDKKKNFRYLKRTS